MAMLKNQLYPVYIILRTLADILGTLCFSAAVFLSVLLVVWCIRRAYP